MEYGHGHASKQWCGITLNAIYVHSGGDILEHGESVFVLLGPGDHSLIVREGVDLPESFNVPNQIIIGRSGGDMKALLITQVIIQVLCEIVGQSVNEVTLGYR